MIYLIPFFCNLITSLLSLILISYSIINNASFEFMAWLGAASAVAYALNSKLAGRFTSPKNCRGIIIAAVICIFCITAAALCINDYHWSLLILIFLSTVMGWFWTPYQIMMAVNYSFSELLMKVCIYNLAWASGSMIGCAAGGITLNLSFTMGLLLTLSLAAVLILLTIFKIPRRVLLSTESAQIDTKPENTGFPKHRLRSFIVKVWIILLCSCIVVGYLRTSHLKVAYDSWQAKPWQQGILSSMTFVVIPLISVVMAITKKWILSDFIIIMALLVTAVAIGSSMVFQNFQFFLIAYAAAGLLNGFSFMSAIYYGCANTENRGSNLGTNEMFVGAGSVLGPLVGGYLDEISNLAGTVMCLFLLFMAILPVSFIKFHKNDRKC